MRFHAAWKYPSPLIPPYGKGDTHARTRTGTSPRRPGSSRISISLSNGIGNAQYSTLPLMPKYHDSARTRRHGIPHKSPSGTHTLSASAPPYRMPIRNSRSNPSRSSSGTADQSGSNSSRSMTPDPGTSNTGFFPDSTSSSSPSGSRNHILSAHLSRNLSNAARSRSGSGHWNVSTGVPRGNGDSDSW